MRTDVRRRHDVVDGVCEFCDLSLRLHLDLSGFIKILRCVQMERREEKADRGVGTWYLYDFLLRKL
jgi:hypothetical protein